MSRFSTLGRIDASCLLLAVTTIGAVSAICAAQAYPTRPVRLIVPFPPGAATTLWGVSWPRAWGTPVPPSIICARSQLCLIEA